MLRKLKNRWYDLKYTVKLALGMAEYKRQYPCQIKDLVKTPQEKCAYRIVKKLQEQGFRAYLVGGFIRDHLVDEQSKDIDIVTDAYPEQICAVFKKSRIIGRRFKLVHVYMDKWLFEVNTFRAVESRFERFITQWKPFRRWKNNFYGNMNQDVLRRDFTCNALYLDLINEKIIDYVGGVEDIKQKRLALIGDVETRLKEDPVRILRALRFRAKTHFKFDHELKKALMEKMVDLKHQSKERVALELVKFFSQGHSKASVQILNQYKAWSVLLPIITPGLMHRHQDYYRSLMDEYDRLSKNASTRRFEIFFWSSFLWPLLKDQQLISFEHESDSVLISVYLKRCSDLLKKVTNTLSLSRRMREEVVWVWKIQYLLQVQPEKELSAYRGSKTIIQSAQRLYQLRKSDSPSVREEQK